MIYILNFRVDPESGGVRHTTTPSFAVETETGNPLDRLSNEERVTFLIHGFNVTQDEGVTSLTELAHRLSGRVKGAFVIVLWPGDSFFGPLGYSWEGQDADDSASSLAGFIIDTWYTGVCSRKPVSLSYVTHSKGARVAMGAAKAVYGRTGNQPDHVCLMAAAVDDSCLADEAVYLDVARNSGQLAVLSSTKDAVLALAYPLGDLVQAFFHAGDTADLALGSHGPKPAGKTKVPDNVHHTPIDPAREVGHGGYLPPSDGSTIERNQLSACQYVIDFLTGNAAPDYH